MTLAPSEAVEKVGAAYAPGAEVGLESESPRQSAQLHDSSA